MNPANLRRGDWVEPRRTPEGFEPMSGFVRRVAKDGTWADIDWGAWTKRQRTESIVVVAMIKRAGWTITDIEREVELREAR